MRKQLLLLPGLVLLACGCSAASQPYTQTGFAMDTVVTQTLWGPAAGAAARAAGQKLQQLERLLSLHDGASEVAAINAAAGQHPVQISAETFALLQSARQLAAATDGAFCLAMAPLTRLWGVGSDDPRVPAPEEIAALLPLADSSALTLDAAAHTAYLARAGQGLDLGGVAKGYACDVLRQVYLDAGVRHALTSVGGNIYALGGRPDGTPFRIGFRDPNGGADSCIASFLLGDGVVAVSGGYERYFVADGVRYHHILDPATGRPASTDIAAVGVVCQNGTKADIFSTALFCMGKEKALAKAAATPDIAILLLDTGGVLYVSPALAAGLTAEKKGVEICVIENESQ